MITLIVLTLVELWEVEHQYYEQQREELKLKVVVGSREGKY